MAKGDAQAQSADLTPLFVALRGRQPNSQGELNGWIGALKITAQNFLDRTQSLTLPLPDGERAANSCPDEIQGWTREEIVGFIERDELPFL